MIKKGLKKDITDFLQMPNKLSSKKKRQINKNKQKVNIGETNSRKAIISNLKNSNKKELPVSILATKTLKLKTKNINIAIIGANAYCIAYYLKRAQVFAISMRNIQYYAKKKVRAEINLKIDVFQEYHDFFDVFSKKNSDTLLLYQKYDHKIHLEKEQKSGHAPLYKMFFQKLDIIK